MTDRLLPNTELAETVRRLLESRTFEAAELPEVLAQRGFNRAEVDLVVQQAAAELAAQNESPARKQSRALARRGARLLRLGVLWLAAGLAYAIFLGSFQLLSLMLLLVPGLALIAAGYRALRLS